MSIEFLADYYWWGLFTFCAALLLFRCFNLYNYIKRRTNKEIVDKRGPSNHVVMYLVSFLHMSTPLVYVLPLPEIHVEDIQVRFMGAIFMIMLSLGAYFIFVMIMKSKYKAELN